MKTGLFKYCVKALVVGAAAIASFSKSFLAPVQPRVLFGGNCLANDGC